MRRSLAITAFMLLAVSPLHAASIGGQGTWQSTLQARDLDGNAATVEAWYDTTLDITWLANANAAGSTMDFANANAWASALVVGSVAGWRLPTVAPINGLLLSSNFSNNATTDNGYADADGWVDGAGAPVSEMGHLFYVTLGNLGLCGANDASPTSCDQPTGWGLSNTGPFDGIQPGIYWTGTPSSTSTPFNPLTAMIFRMNFGDQDWRGVTNSYSAWAVHDGDVGAQVPLPGAAWLFASALLGLGGAARSRRGR